MTITHPSPPQGTLADVFPQHVEAVLGPPPLLPGEDHAAYRRLLVQLSLTLVPANIVEWLELKEIGDLSWELLRWRRLRGAYLFRLQRDRIEGFLRDKAEPRGMRSDLIPAARETLMAAWARGEPKAGAKVDAILARHGRTAEDFAAGTVFERLDELQCLEGLIAATADRRTAALRDIERRRGTRAGGLRRMSDEILDAFPLAPSPGACHHDPDERLGRPPDAATELDREAGGDRPNAGQAVLACVHVIAPVTL